MRAYPVVTSAAYACCILLLLLKCLSGAIFFISRALFFQTQLFILSTIRSQWNSGITLNLYLSLCHPFLSVYVIRQCAKLLHIKIGECSYLIVDWLVIYGVLLLEKMVILTTFSENLLKFTEETSLVSGVSARLASEKSSKHNLERNLKNKQKQLFPSFLLSPF